MKPFSRGLAAGVALIACVLLLLAAVPSQTDFDGTYFKTNALPISLVGTLTNWAKINTNAVVSKAGDTMTGTLIAPEVDVVTGKFGNVTVTNAITVGGTNITGSLADKAPLASPALTGTPTINGTAISTNWTDTATNTAARGSVSVPGQMGFTGYTTAALPTGVAVGYQTYCTDCLTPWGVGDRVEWDGSAWNTLRCRTLVTTDIYQYMLNGARSMYELKTPIEFSASDIPTCGSGWTGTGSGTGNAATLVQIAGSVWVSYSTGTTTNGYYQRYSTLSTAGAVTNYQYSLIGRLAPSALCDGTDNYAIACGFGTSPFGIAAALGTKGAALVYDAYNQLGYGITATNNWQLVTRRSSTGTVTDTGIPVTTAQTNYFAVIVNGTTDARAYINGICVATNITNLPDSLGPGAILGIQKSAGTTARVLSVQATHLVHRNTLGWSLY